MTPTISEKSIKTAKQVASSFYKKNPGLEFNEILSESYLMMMDAVNTWNPEKGRTLQSWIGFIVHRELRKKLHKGELTSNSPVFICHYENIEEQVINHLDPERILLEKEKIYGLSQLSRNILDMAFAEVQEGQRSKNKIKAQIKERLRTQGVSCNKIQVAFHELRMAAA